ncbi:histidine kinase dimerization/phosphoacceptor domain -containing protein [Maribacter sp. Asnod1-A12]|uniref:histidine kinase dimerization/phosphoacceptor domain -containing protein n=1 Tax=Maribacter sp. Asnod1-A12 TaxID=3160576 RepID=UPI003864CAF1
MRKLLFAFFVLCSMLLWCQQEPSILINKSIYSSRDGYLISNPYHSIYDSTGWLWVLGENKLSNEYVFGDKEIIIQRFDGAIFFNLALPDTFDKRIKEGHFFKHKEKGLYLKLYYTDDRADLFFIDTDTLQITPVDAYNHLSEKYIISKEFQVNNETRLIITSEEKFYSAALDGLGLRILDSIPFNGPVKNPFLEEIRSTEASTIVKLLFINEGILLNRQGKITKKIASTDFIDNQGHNFYPNEIHNSFAVNNEYFFYLDDYENVFKFDQENLRFIEIPNTNESYDSKKDMVFDNNFENGFLNEVVSDYSEVKFYDLNEFYPHLTLKIKIKNYSKTAYSQFGEDLVVLNGNTLESYSFKNSKIKTFLRGKSIRTIKKLSENKYIVATDTEGVYTINTKDNTEEKIKFTLDNKEISMNYSRDIYVNEDHTITINDSDNLYTTDANYKVIKDRSLKIIGEEIIKIEDTIFTADQRGIISQFSINEKKYTTIPNTESVQIREFATNGTRLFGTTVANGIFEYENGSFETHVFENEKAENLLSINYLKDFGVLVATKFGKIYTYDSDKNRLKLLYEDALKASIVGMVTDNNNNLWLNTYAGIVSVNRSTQKIVRYTVKDGVYELEGNRYGTYRDPEGNIWMGSYKGLSYFNPNDLSTIELNAQPQFTSVSYFDAGLNRWQVHSSPQFLDSIQTINLPSEYQRFSATMSVFGQLDRNNISYKYRLSEKGNDSDWFTSYPGKEILFANLAPGEYILEVQAVSASDEEIGNTIELRVISEKIFYKTWWFILALILLVFGLISYLFYQYKGKQKILVKNEIALNESKIKTSMMLEIHHRIKNNLQIVSGLLGLQVINSANEELKLKLQDSQSRIESIAGIHNLLYNSDSFETLSFKENVDNIIRYYQILFPLKVGYTLNFDGSMLPIDKATPLSLLLNELISNSHKHAFSDEEQPEIHIYFIKCETKYEFKYFDNGNFKEKGFKKDSMGMKIVDMMTTQLKGDLKIDNSKGFMCTLIFS